MIFVFIDRSIEVQSLRTQHQQVSGGLVVLLGKLPVPGSNPLKDGRNISRYGRFKILLSVKTKIVYNFPS